MQKPIREQKAVLIILLSNIFIVFLGIGLIIPVMPLFMNVMHLTGSTMGYLVAAFAVAQLIASPIAGRWVDRFGRKIMILAGLFLFALSELTFGLGTHVSILYFARVLGGISAAFIMPAVTAYVADITTVQERSKAMGYVSAAISTGFIHRARHRRVYCRSRRSHAVFLCRRHCFYRSDFLSLYAERAIDKRRTRTADGKRQRVNLLKRFEKVDSSKLSNRLYHRLCAGIRAVGVRNGIQFIYKP